MNDIRQHDAQITSGTISIQKSERWDICYFCMSNSFSKYELFEKHVCSICQEKLLRRIHLIMQFE